MSTPATTNTTESDISTTQTHTTTTSSSSTIQNPELDASTTKEAALRRMQSAQTLQKLLEQIMGPSAFASFKGYLIDPKEQYLQEIGGVSDDKQERSINKKDLEKKSIDNN